MATFKSLPLEIRREIYSYLLSSERVYARTEGVHPSIYPDFTTSIFTVSKQISTEGREYFYGKNAFVAFCEIPDGVRLRIQLILPTITMGERTESWLHCKKNIALYGDIDWHWHAQDPKLVERQVLVCASYYLPTIVRLFNAYNFAKGCVRSGIRARFYSKLTCCYYKENRAIATQITMGLQGLKAERPSLSDGVCRYQFYDFENVSQQMNDLSGMMLSNYIHKTFEDDCRWALREGDQANKDGDFVAAAIYYDFILWWLGMWDCFRHAAHFATSQEAITIETWMHQAYNSFLGENRRFSTPLRNAVSKIHNSRVTYRQTQLAHVYFISSCIYTAWGPRSKNCQNWLLAARENCDLAMQCTVSADFLKLVERKKIEIDFKMTLLNITSDAFSPHTSDNLQYQPCLRKGVVSASMPVNETTS